LRGTIDADLLPSRTPGAATLVARVASNRRYSGGHEHKVGGVAAVQRQFFDPLRVDGVIERGRSRVNLGSGRSNGHRLRDVAYLQADINPNVLVGPEQDVPPLILAESRLLDTEIVRANREKQKSKSAACVGCRGA
jgi:hypothetical protein